MPGNDRSAESPAIVAEPNGNATGGNRPTQGQDLPSHNPTSNVALTLKQAASPQEPIVGQPQNQTEQPDPYQLRDLKAQEVMAYWAMWMFVAAVLTFIITSFGTWLIWRQIRLTRKAVEDTGKATKAMERQNELTFSAQRAWLKIEPSIIQAHSNENAMDIQWRVDFTNVGKTFALNVSYRAEVEAFEHFSATSAIEEEFSHLLMAPDHTTTALAPRDSVWLGGAYRYKFDALPWDKTNKCFVVIIVRADYRIVGSDSTHTTARAFAIGFKDKDMFRQRSFERPVDIETGILIERLDAYPLGPTIST